MGRTRVAIVGVSSVALVAAMAACAAFAGSDVNDREQPDAGATEDAVARDVGTDASVSRDARATDATVDGAALDAGAAVDAKSDGSCAPLEGGFCASLVPAATFCADFDNPQCILPGSFASVSTATGTVVKIDSEHQKSSPNALHVTEDAGTAHTAAWGPVLSFTVPTPGATASSIEIDLEFRVPAIPPVSGGPRLGVIHLDATASGGPTIDFYMESDKSYFVIGSGDYSDNGVSATVDTWHSLSFTFQISPNGSSAFDGVFDGTTLFANHDMQTPLQGGHALKVTTGYSAFTLTQGETFVDNLVVRVTP